MSTKTSDGDDWLLIVVEYTAILLETFFPFFMVANGG
jgi:hypothetical protein